jgi:hypothetical protein
MHLAMARAALALYQPTETQGNVTRWRINGYRAAIILWTAEEWERLTERPTDAQYFPCGVWCALRME